MNERADAPIPSLGAVFAGFFEVGVTGFGGVMPFARRMIVQQRRWLSPAEFNDLLALCQFLPGPNIINLSVALGARYHGLPGSVAAYSGLMAAPMTIIVGLGMLYERYGDVPVVGRAFGGLAAVAAGLVISNAARIAVPLRGQPVAISVAVVTFCAIALLRFPLLPVILIMAAISVALVWFWKRS